mgnify:CR=1 FL=1
MEILPLTKDDIAICVNYVTAQYSKYSGSNNTRGLAERVEYAMEDKEGWKVVEDGKIIGYAVLEDFGPNLLITSLVIDEPYRTGKATWLLFKKILEISKGRNGVYKPIHENMLASKLCVNGRIDRERAVQWVNALSKKWS